MRMRSTFVNSCCCCCCCDCFRQMILFWKPARHVPKTVLLRCSRKQNVPHFVPSAMWHPAKELYGALVWQLNCLLHSSRPRKAFCACCLRLSVDKSWKQLQYLPLVKIRPHVKHCLIGGDIQCAGCNFYRTCLSCLCFLCTACWLCYRIHCVLRINRHSLDVVVQTEMKWFKVFTLGIFVVFRTHWNSPCNFPRL